MTSPDVEKQDPKVGTLTSTPTRTRTRTLDCCLLTSVITLFALVAGICVCAVLFYGKLQELIHLQSKLPQGGTMSPQKNPEMDVPMPQSSYKAQNIAYLRASSSEVKSGVMPWETFSYGRGISVGSRYKYSHLQHSLTVQKEGSYFLYVELKLQCIHKCESAKFTVNFRDQSQVRLSCPVELTEEDFTPETTKCWTVIPHLNKDSHILARLESNSELQNWSLEMNESGFGMFLIDGPKDH